MIPVLLAAVLIPFLQPPPQPSAQPAVVFSYVPQRVYDARQKAFSDFETMLADLARADAVFVGEQHNDPNTHRLELAIIEELTRRGVSVVVAMEMFERDVQPTVDQYAAGTISEAAFLAASRPWPQYASDYRPIIEFAKVNHLPIVASNVPRRIASDVSKTGMAVVEGLGNDRRLAARELQCPTSGDYYDRFIGTMADHPAPDADASVAADTTARNDRFYFAQCVKDETMGESVAEAFQKSAAGRVTIVHVNGAFHSDFGEGTAASARRRLPGRRIAVVSVLPVEDIDTARPADDDMKRGDYLLFTVSRKP
jgi:uncharacterized iron-regulated protein